MTSTLQEDLYCFFYVDAFFYYGTSGSTPSKSGTALPDEQGRMTKLEAYPLFSAVFIDLRPATTVDNIEWFSVWCDQANVSEPYAADTATYHLSIYSFEQRVLVSIYLSEQILIAQ